MFTFDSAMLFFKNNQSNRSKKKKKPVKTFLKINPIPTSTSLLVACEENEMVENKLYSLTDNTSSFPVIDCLDSKIKKFVPKSKKEMFDLLCDLVRSLTRAEHKRYRSNNALRCPRKILSAEPISSQATATLVE